MTKENDFLENKKITNKEAVKKAKKKLNQKIDTPMAEDRRATLKGGGICKKGMNRKAIGKNS